MSAHGVATVESLEDEHPESTTTEKSRQKDHPPRPGEASTPRFLGKIGNVKPNGEDSVLEKNDGSRGLRTKDEAIERTPWLRVGQPSKGDINHVAQVGTPQRYSKSASGGRLSRPFVEVDTALWQ